MGGVRIMKVILSADHAGVTVRNEMNDLLTEMNIDYVDTGCDGSGSVDYPEFALAAAELFLNGEFDRGILIGVTGIGMSYAEKKVGGNRCAVAYVVYSVKDTCRHTE